MDNQNEILNKAKNATADFKTLCTQGVVGFYESCEVTQVFLIEKNTKKIFNYYTLIVFEESKDVGTQMTYLTNKPLNINKEYQLGITQIRIAISEAQSLFQEIQKGSFTLNSKQCEIGKKFALLPKQFIPKYWNGQKPPLMSLLKPNYWGDSYIIEFFCENKTLIKKLDEKDIDTINRDLSSTASISIDLTKIYERTENIIFQFPVTLISCVHSLKQNESIDVKIQTHPKIKIPLDILITAKTFTDHNVTGFFNQQTKSDQTSITLPLGDSDNVELTIVKSNSSIMLHHSLSNYIRSISGCMHIHLPHSKPRTITTKTQQTYSIEIAELSPWSVNIREHDFFQQINHRKIENDLLEKSGDCRVFKNGDKIQAYEFVKFLIQKHNQDAKEICLWDPYLSASDIIETLYFESTGRPFRCITSLEKAKQINKENQLDGAIGKDIDFRQFKKNQMDYFQTHSNNLQVNLDFRCQHANYGTPFHDRFLIFVPNDAHDLPKTYSLGTSVNALGKKHHLIQKTADARLILKNFNELWDALPPNDCRIVLFPKDLQ